MTKHLFNDNYCFRLLKDLIEIDTSQPNGNEKYIVKKICSLFKDTTEKKIIKHSENRWTLIISFRGEVDDSIALIGHTDTVSYGNIDDWNTSPLTATKNGDIVFGRGTADMKGGVVSLICAALAIENSNIKPKKTIHFCFTADEEYSGLGAKSLADWEEMKNVKEMIIAEPSNGKISICEKGALWLKFTSHGKSAHASTPNLGINAIENLTKLYYDLSKTMKDYGKYSYLGEGSVQITKLQGGIMTNVIPSEATMEVDIRMTPNVSLERLESDINNIIKNIMSENKGLSITIDVLNKRNPIMTDENNDFIKKVDSVCDKMNIPKEKRGHNFYTDAAQILSKHDIPFIIFGPGNDEFAHKTNEQVNLSDIINKSEFYWNYLKKYYL